MTHTPLADSTTGCTPQSGGLRPATKRFLQVLLLAVLVLPALAAAYLSTAPTSDRNWFWQNPVPQGNDLRSMAWINTTQVWAVGVSGTALKSTDAGRTWSVLDLGTTRDLTGASFATTTTGWVVGLSGTIRKTTDGGSTWTTQTAPTAANLRAVSAWSTTGAIALGDSAATATLIYTTNGGVSWLQSNATSTVSLSDVQMSSAATGWAVGVNGTVLKTTNGGASWTTLPALTTGGLTSISFAPGGVVGYYVGNAVSGLPTIFKTVNSGATWTAIGTLGTGGVNLFAVNALDANNAVVTGAGGLIRRTSDGGATWTNQTQTNIAIALRDIRLVDANSNYVIGDAGTMCYSKDGGLSWFSLGKSTLATWLAVDFADVNNGWAVGTNGAIMHSTDAGQSWDNLNLGQGAWRAVSSFNTTTAWVAGDSGRIAKTVNGTDWSYETTITTQQLNGVWFTTALNGVAVGAGGVVLRTTDGGATWLTRTSGTTSNLNAVWFADANIGYAVGDGGVIVRTGNAGSTWAVRTSSTTTNLVSVTGDPLSSTIWVGSSGGGVRRSTNGGQNAAGWTDQSAAAGAGSSAVRTINFLDANNGWFTADYGIVRKTANGGTTWTTQNAGVPTSTLDPLTRIYGASFPSATTGYLVGDGGVARRTLDGGSTWGSVQYGTFGTMYDLVFPDSSNGWAIGSAATLLRTADGGQSWVQQRPGTTSNFYGVWMTDSLRGWVVGENGTIRRTTDGGTSWVGQASNTNLNLTSIVAGDASHAVVAGSGTVKYTLNAGSTWTTASVLPTQSVTSLAMIGTSAVWAVSTHGTGNNVVWSSTDGGATWSPQATGVNANFWDVWFIDANNGFVAGDGGVILRTTNGGGTWTRIPTPTTSALYAVKFRDANYGLATGAGGVMLSTVDGGATWSLRQSGTSQNLRALGFAGSIRGFAVGDNGTLIRNDSVVPPTTTLAVAPSSPTGANGWYAPTAPTLTLSSSASGGTKYYSWNSAAGPFTAYSAPFSAIEGNRNVYFYSADASSNPGPVASQAIKSDLTSPTAPITTGIDVISTSSVSVTWTPGADAVSGVDHYDLFINGSFATSTSALTAVISGLTPNTLYTTITVQAVDMAGLRSDMTTPTLSALTRSIATAPYQTVLTANPLAPNGTNGWYVTAPTVTLSSIPDDGQSRTTFYSWESASGAWTPYTVPLTPASGATVLYYYTHDNVGGRADELVHAQPFLLDTQTPPTPIVTAAAADYQSINASWTPGAAPPSGFDHWDVYFDGVLDSSVTTPEASFSGLTPLSTHTVVVRAVSSAGATSALSATQTVTTPNPPKPLPPAVVYAKAPNSSRVYIDWTASSNVAGEVSYHVWKSLNGVDYSVIATVTGGVRVCSYIDQPLGSSTRYWYAVSTIDARGESSLSDTSTAVWPYTAPITIRPQRPVGLTATGMTPSSILLQWAPSPDLSLLGYYVYRADSSMAATATTLTIIPTTATAFFDFTAKEGPPYWYSVKAVDASGTLSFASIEAEGYTTLSPVNGVTMPHEAGPQNASCICHATHTASGYDKLTRFPGSGAQTLCQPTCHAPGHAGQQFVDPLLKSKHPEGAAVTPEEPFSCITCHVPLFPAGGHANNLMRTDGVSACSVVTGTPAGNGFCYKCHGTGSTLVQGDLTIFESSGHSTVPAPATGANITCDACHESHSSRNEFLLRFSGVMVCMQCHTASPTNPNTVDIYDELTMNDNSNAAHPLLPEDQVGGAQMSCQNCHNTHSANKNYPLVNPHNPSPAGKWLKPTEDEAGFCFQCHNGQPLPTSQETTPWASPVLASGGATTTTNIQLAYQTNFHGYGQESDSTTTTAYLRPDMGYKYGDVLQCKACHEPHGATNSFAIRDNILSANGDKTITGVLTVPMASGQQRDFRFLCATCHVFDAAAHDASHGTTITLSPFPYNCRACHRHTRSAF